jgi:hypothetical protein
MTASILDQLKTLPTSKLAAMLENIELYLKNPEYAAKAQTHLKRKTGGDNIRERADEATRQLREAIKAEIGRRAKGGARA